MVKQIEKMKKIMMSFRIVSGILGKGVLTLKTSTEEFLVEGEALRFMR